MDSLLGSYSLDERTTVDQDIMDARDAYATGLNSDGAGGGVPAAQAASVCSRWKNTLLLLALVAVSSLEGVLLKKASMDIGSGTVMNLIILAVYVAVFAAVVLVRSRLGYITEEIRRVPKRKFAKIAILDGLT